MSGARTTWAAFALAAGLLVLITGRPVADVMTHMQKLRLIVYISDTGPYVKNKYRSAFAVLSQRTADAHPQVKGTWWAPKNDWLWTFGRSNWWGVDKLQDTPCLVVQYSTVQTSRGLQAPAELHRWQA